MNREEWRQVKTIVSDALSVEESRREAYIKEACQGNEHLLTEVKEQLESIGKSDEEGFLNNLRMDQKEFVEDLSHQLNQSTKPKDLIGQKIGPYEITDLLGSGGMGSVYKAERIDGTFQHTVAIKLIKSGVASDEVVRRFKQEREILASLSHPNIAQLHDGGATPEGTPYLVMEFVDGEPIDVWCDKKQYSIKERLGLFQKACEAIQFAHQNMIVHRDLKPQNILVSTDGQVKILDFGIAKMLKPDHTVMETKLDNRMWTPQFAAPEQVTNKNIGITTDVYALGALLYTLLAGKPPYNFDGKSTYEIESLILEEDPLAASKRVAKAGKNIWEDGGFGNRKKLQKILRGDLDAIMLKAMRRESKFRYQSVNDLLDDLRRYESDLPLRAQKDSLRYRSSKFWKRHKAALLGILILIGITITYIFQITEERNQAQLEAQKATEVTEFLLGLFEANEPLTTPTDTITARALLERGVLRAEEMEEQPLVQAQMFDVMGRVYKSLGRYDRAEPLLRKALILRENQLGEKHAKVAGSLNHLAELLITRGKYTEADSLFNRTINLMHAIYGKKDSTTAVAMSNLAILFEKQGQFSKAEKLHRKVLSMRRDIFGGIHLDIGASLNHLATLLYRKGNYDEAKALYNEALNMKRQLLEPTHSSIANTMLGLATTLEANGNFTSADSLYRETLAIQRRLLGNEHPRVATTISNLANVLIRQNKLPEAETLHKEALAIRRNHLSEANPEVGESLYSLAFLKSRMANYEKAKQLYRKAIDAWRPVLGDEHPNIALAMNNIARLFSMQGRYREALIINRDVLEKHRTIYGEESPQVALSLGNIAWDLYETMQYTEAEKYYRKALATRRTLYDSAHPEIADALSGLGAVLCEQKKYKEAEDLQKKSLQIRRKVHGNDHPRIAYSLSRLGDLYIRTARYTKAESSLLKAFQLRHNELGANHPKTRESTQQLLDFYQIWNKPEKVAEYRTLLSKES